MNPLSDSSTFIQLAASFKNRHNMRRKITQYEGAEGLVSFHQKLYEPKIGKEVQNNERLKGVWYQVQNIIQKVQNKRGSKFELL